MAFPFLLLGAQAAGIGFNIWQNKRQSRYEAMGAQIEQQEMQLQMQQEALASTQQSLANTEQLRDVLATQRAIFASRGTSSRAAFTAGQTSLRAYNADEQARELSLTFRKHQTETAQRLKSLNLYAGKQKRKADLFGQSLSLLNFNGLGGTGGLLNG